MRSRTTPVHYFQMRILIDSHILLWFVTDHVKLSDQAKDLMEEQSNDILYSAVGMAELYIKQAKNKLKLPEKFHRHLTNLHIHELPLHFRHLPPLTTLPYHHYDPFDRMMIAQAMVDDLFFLSQDRHFQKYNIKLLNY